MRYLQYATAPNNHGADSIERLILALDVSPSMEETDWPPSRLAAAVAASRALLQRKRKIAPQDEVGIVTFSGSADVHCPTLAVGRHHRAIVASLNNITTDNGTNITAALQCCETVLRPRKPRLLLDRLFPPLEATPQPTQHRIILLTDGEINLGGSPLPVAKRLKQHGVTIDCIGIGGDPSAVDEDLLKSVASIDVDGFTPRYSFIGDKNDLITKFEELAGRICR